jgi:poly-gamma-glutamate synthesis protein (capsule biosynthesis protein)
LISFLLFSCNSKSLPQQEIVEETQPEQEEKSEKYSLTLLAAGDNLFHITIVNNALEKGEYNFTPIYSQIKCLIENADIAFINQETVMAGASFGYSSFPKFNTPRSLAHTLADTGFDIINIANNHTMDMGEDGINATLDFLDTIEGITVIGVRKKGDSHRIIEKNNITLGFLSYTYGLNNNPLPADKPNLVSVISREKMSREINILRPLCDFLIVSMHWGPEYLLIEPDSYQKGLAVFLAEQNVDLIIGHHPHVLQLAETLPRPDGGKTLCFYSLGNFVSHQTRKERILEGLMFVTFTKEGEKLSITKSGLIPVICHFEQGYKNTKVYPIYEYTEELLEKHILKTRDNDMDFNFFHSVLRKLDTKIIMYNPFPSTEGTLSEMEVYEQP